MPETDIHLTCIRCGQPASLGPEGKGEHHDPPDYRTGKGMGGTSLEETRESTLPLCRRCHRDYHAKRFAIRVDGPIAYCIDPKTGEILSVRALSPRVLEGDYGPADVDLEVLIGLLPRLDDESLAWLWDCGVRWEEQGVILEALAAKGFHEHYHSFGDGWFNRAAEIIRETTGRPMAVGTVYNRDNTAMALQASGWRMELLGTLGRSVLAEVGKNEDPVRALEMASEMRDAGERAVTIVNELTQTRRKARPNFSESENLEEQPDPSRVWGRCPHCEYVGWIERLPEPEKCVLSEVRELLGEETQ
jgi:ribosomal protein L37E